MVTIYIQSNSNNAIYFFDLALLCQYSMLKVNMLSIAEYSICTYTDIKIYIHIYFLPQVANLK